MLVSIYYMRTKEWIMSLQTMLKIFTGSANTSMQSQTKSGVSVVNSATLLFPWLGELGIVLLEHEKFCARNMANVR